MLLHSCNFTLKDLLKFISLLLAWWINFCGREAVEKTINERVKATLTLSKIL